MLRVRALRRGPYDAVLPSVISLHERQCPAPGSGDIPDAGPSQPALAACSGALFNANQASRDMLLAEPSLAACHAGARGSNPSPLSRTRRSCSRDTPEHLAHAAVFLIQTWDLDSVPTSWESGCGARGASGEDRDCRRCAAAGKRDGDANSRDRRTRRVRQEHPR